MRINGQFRFLSCIAEHEYCDLLERGDDLNGKKALTAIAPLIYQNIFLASTWVWQSCCLFFLAPHTVQTLNSSCSVCFIHLKWTFFFSLFLLVRFRLILIYQPLKWTNSIKSNAKVIISVDRSIRSVHTKTNEITTKSICFSKWIFINKICRRVNQAYLVTNVK